MNLGEPVQNTREWIKNNTQEARRIVFRISIQFLPIWIMLLLGVVADYQWELKELISNLLIYTIVACATVLAGTDIRETKNSSQGNASTSDRKMSYIIILIFSSGIYFLVLLDMLLISGILRLVVSACVFIAAVFVAITSEPYN